MYIAWSPSEYDPCVTYDSLETSLIKRYYLRHGIKCVAGKITCHHRCSGSRPQNFPDYLPLLAFASMGATVKDCDVRDAILRAGMRAAQTLASQLLLEKYQTSCRAMQGPVV